MRFLTWILGIAATLCAACIAFPTHAATVWFAAPGTAYPSGAEIPVSVLLDTAGEEANAIEATIQVTGATIRDIRDGNTAVALWPRYPKAEGDERVSFAGVFPGGRAGQDLLLLTLILQAESEGGISIGTEAVSVLRNDGAGSALLTTALPYTIQITATAAPQDAPPGVTDREPPDPFTPLVVQEALVANGAPTLLFFTQDKGSGIHHYEIFETPREMTRETDVHWIRAESPHVLADQERKSFIYLKAVDRAGNERIERVDPLHTRAWWDEKEYQNMVVWAVGFIFILWYPFRGYPWKKRGKIF